jgi:hypothetical protein
MRVGSFSLLVPEGRERDSGHVEIPHGQVYTLRIGNHLGRRCDAEVTVDGKPIGGFRVESFQTITLERPGHDTGRFTFYKAGTSEAQAAGESKVASDDRGLVQVVFRPEKTPPAPPPRVGHVHPMGMSAGPQYQSDEVKTSGGIIRPRSMGGGQSCSAFPDAPAGFETYGGASPTSASPGVTGLSGQSRQRFYDVAPVEFDPTECVTITLRLVAVEVGPRELTPADRGTGNAVPAPLP